MFAARAGPAKKRRWLAEGESREVEEFEVDFRIGGTERVRYRFKQGTPFPGTTLTNDGSYRYLAPNRRLMIASAMTLVYKRISASLATVEFAPI